MTSNFSIVKLLPLRPRAIVHQVAHGTSGGNSLDYTTNKHEITVYYTLADDVKLHEVDVGRHKFADVAHQLS